ncbi:uncharacterized protein BJ212DRAFT_1311719 [Suillus subaureus]|uniref:Uncharacterized protein n=1 Tax=Suillus subaureus TaxID=48587 RepID=A0A9P7JK96_9AGAM|nr:uncharacterized protein BJ212DRAFT_1311719 [Suillus subaureus]KAG1827351.1 hypothetical protein BJ212DRAFT_1311719 [Suillus subaureus]
MLTVRFLGTIAKRRDVQINYANFNIAIKERLGINVRGWPEGIPFQSLTSLNDLSALQKIHDALKDGSAHCKKGEVIGKPHKKHGDAGVPCKCKGNGKENTCLRKQVQALGSSMQAPKSAEFVETTDKDDTSEEEV